MFTRLRVIHRIRNIQDFTAEFETIGVNAGMAINFKRGVAVYTNWFQRKPTVFNINNIAKNSHGQAFIVPWDYRSNSGSYGVTLHTNMYDAPIIDFGCWTKKQAGNCRIALQNFTDESRKNERKTDLHFLMQKFEKKASGDINVKRKIGKRKCAEYIEFLLCSIKGGLSRPWTKGDNLLVLDIMYFHFGREEGEPREKGYLRSYLERLITNEKVRLENDGIEL